MSFVSRLFSFLLRLVVVGLGLVFGLVLLLGGLFMATVLVIWSLLRGRKPQVMRFRMNPGSPFGGMNGGMNAGMRGRTAPQGDVVDIEAREVPDIPQQLPRDRA
ncbi:MAG: hypothetical protein ABW190_11520 [Rhizobacter sp.]